MVGMLKCNLTYQVVTKYAIDVAWVSETVDIES